MSGSCTCQKDDPGYERYMVMNCICICQINDQRKIVRNGLFTVHRGIIQSQMVHHVSREDVEIRSQICQISMNRKSVNRHVVQFMVQIYINATRRAGSHIVEQVNVYFIVERTILLSYFFIKIRHLSAYFCYVFNYVIVPMSQRRGVSFIRIGATGF